MMVLTQASALVDATDSHATTASQDSKSNLQWEIELLEEQVLGISRRNTRSPPVEETAIEDVDMLGKTNEGDQSPTVYVESCSPDLSLNCSITSSNKNSLAHTLSLISQASQYYSSGEDNSVAFDIRNIIYEGKSHLWQHSMEDLLHAEILISLKTGFTAGKTKLSPKYMEQGLSEPPSHPRNKRKYEDLKNEKNDPLTESGKSLNDKQNIDVEGRTVNEDSPFVLTDVQKSKSLDLSKAIKDVITDQNEMNAASMEVCPYHHDVCGCTKTRDVYLSTNTRSHSGLIPYKCGICGEKFADNGILRRHVKTHKTPFLYECDVCGKEFQHSSSLKFHMKMHKTEDASTARYSNTGRDTFYNESSAEKSIHECEVSEKRLRRGDEHSKKDHLSSLQYFSVSSKNYKNCFGRLQCLSCLKSFPNRHQLKIHAVYHSEPRFKCLVCDKAFYQKYQLQVHQISHTGMPQFVCSICDQSFLFAFSLRMHMRLHTSIRILRRMLQSAQASAGRSVTTKTKNIFQVL